MKCPECYLENERDEVQCAACGSDLTQTALTSAASHHTNQVWNADIDPEKNRKNSRLALIVLGASAVLLAVLIVVAIALMPSGDMSLALPDFDLSEVFEIFEPAPEPDYPQSQVGAVSISGKADVEFQLLTEEFLREFYRAKTEGGHIQQAKVVMDYRPAFEQFQLRVVRKLFGTELVVESEFSDGNLQNYASSMVAALGMMADSVVEQQVTADYRGMYIADRLQWAAGHVELAEAVRELVWYVNLLEWETEIPRYFTKRLPYYTACVELEADLQNQLPTLPSIPGDASFPYTNHTPYSMDIVFYNEYLTEDGMLSDQIAFEQVEPGETIVIPLEKRPARAVADQVSWTIRWDITACYWDGVNVME